MRVDTTYTEYGADGKPVDDAEGMDATMVRHEQAIWAGQTSSSCERCADSADVRSMPLGAYAMGNVGKHVMIGPGIVRRSDQISLSSVDCSLHAFLSPHVLSVACCANSS